MKKFYLLLFIFILKKQVCFGQITFQKTYGGNSNDEGYAVQQTSDNGYVIVGFTVSYGTGNKDIYLFKTDSLGNLLWTKTYGGIYNDEGSYVQQTSDGGYVIAGKAGSGDACIIKTDIYGDTLWTKTFGGNNQDNAYCVKQTTDGCYIVAGQINYQAFLMKTDSTGNLLWANSYNGISSSIATSVLETGDGGFVAAGSTNSSFYLFKTDSSGNMLWSKAYGGSSVQNSVFVSSFQKTFDNGFILVGARNDWGPACDENIYIVKTDSIGNLLWSKQFAESSYLNEKWSVLETNGGYMLAGSFYDCSSHEHSVYLIRTNIFGTPMWSKTIGPIGIDAAYSFQPTNDAGYIIGGMSRGSSNGDYNVYLIKADSNGISGCYENNFLTTNIITTTDTVSAATVVTNINNLVTSYSFFVGTGGTDSTYCFSSTGINEEAYENSFIISPNPFTSSLSIKGIQKGEIKIFDLTGKEILRQKIINTETKINTEHLSPGFYLVNYSKEDVSVNSKIVKF